MDSKASVCLLSRGPKSMRSLAGAQRGLEERCHRLTARSSRSFWSWRVPRKFVFDCHCLYTLVSSGSVLMFTHPFADPYSRHGSARAKRREDASSERILGLIRLED